MLAVLPTTPTVPDPTGQAVHVSVLPRSFLKVSTRHCEHLVPVPMKPVLQEQLCVPGPVLLHSAFASQSDVAFSHELTAVHMSATVLISPSKCVLHVQSEIAIAPFSL